jgi:PAS domain S-box-containing protein
VIPEIRDEEANRLGQGNLTPPPPLAAAAAAGRPWLLIEGFGFLALFLIAAWFLSSGVPAFKYAIFWLPSGIALVACWRLGLRAVPLIAVGVVIYRFSLGQPASRVLPLVLAPVLEALTGYAVLRYLRFRPQLSRLRDALSMILAAIVAPMAGATWACGVYAVFGASATDLARIWLTWWSQNALGIMVVAPVVLCWTSLPLVQITGRTLVDSFLGLLGVGFFYVLVVSGAASPDLGMSLSFLTMGAALYAAVQYGPRGAVTASAALVIVGVLGSASGVGPYAIGNPDTRQLTLQVYALVITTAPLMIGALIREREGIARARVRTEQAFLQAGADLAFLFDADGKILDLYVPPGLPHGLTNREAVVGRNVAEVVEPSIQRLTMHAIARALTGVPAEPIEYALGMMGGTRTREARFVNFGGGKVLALVRDITERRQAEQLLAWQTPVLENIAEGESSETVLARISAGVESLTEDGLCTVMLLDGKRLRLGAGGSVDPEYSALINGDEIGPMSGSCGTAAYEDRPVIVSSILDDPLWANYRFAAERFGLMACWSIPFHATSGAVLGTLAVYYRESRAPTTWERAILERGAALAGIAVERERREHLLDSISRTVNEGIFRASPGSGLVYANRAFARMFGFDSDAEMMAVPTVDLYDDPRRREDVLAVLNGEGEIRNEEVLYRRRDGTVFWGLLSAAAVRDEASTVLYYDGAVSDVTDRKQLEEELRQTQKMEAVGKLAGGVAHDFNNLLTAIQGYAVMLAESLPPDSTAHRDVDEITRAASRAAGLTRQLLAYSRRQVLSPEVLDLRQVVDELGTMLRRLIGENIQLVTRHTSSETFVRVDRGQIEQVILNLVLNARDAMPQGGTVTVTTAVIESAPNASSNRRRGGTGAARVQLTVEDTGTGMDEATCERAFDPFFTTKGPGEGTGLGLSTVFGIVEQSAGSIHLDSTPGAGTMVRVYLPRVTERPATAGVVAQPPRRRGGGTILIAEDEQQVRELTCRLLRQAGYAVLAAADGEEALQIARGHSGPIDLLLTDVIMPRLSGDELAARLLVSRPGVPVLFVSGYTNETLGSDGMRAGTRYLQKPFVPAMLLECVEELLTARPTTEGWKVAPTGLRWRGLSLAGPAHRGIPEEHRRCLP